MRTDSALDKKKQAMQVKTVISLFFFLSASAIQAEEVLRVGLPDCEEHFLHSEIKKDLKEAVQKAFGKDKAVSFSEMPLSDMDLLIKTGRLDFILSSSGALRSLANFKPTPLVTVTYRQAPNPNFGDASAVFVLKDIPIQTLSDLQGKSIAAKMPNGFTGWQAVEREVLLLNKSIENFFKSTAFLGWKSTDVLDSVLHGKTDAGVVQTCFIEKMAAENPVYRDVFRVLQRPGSTELLCSHTTRPYPNWTVSAARHVPAQESQKLVAALLDNSAKKDFQWVVGADFQEVDKMLKDLKLEPYDYLRHWTFKRFFETYPIQITLALGCLLALLMYLAAVQRLVKRRAYQLSEALKRQEKYRKQLALSDKRLETLKRMGLLNQVSSILIHELRQPLNTIACYAQGLLRRADNHNLKEKDLKKILSEVLDRTTSANDIVCRLRSFIKEGRKKEEMDLSEVTKEVVSAYLLSSHCHEEIKVIANQSCFLYFDKFEFELLLMNLLRNASEALIAVSSPQILVQVTQKEKAVVITVTDNGKTLSDAQIQAVSTPLSSQKAEGMGIGLMIVREIVQDNNGEITFETGKNFGLKVTIIFPASAVKDVP